MSLWDCPTSVSSVSLRIAQNDRVASDGRGTVAITLSFTPSTSLPAGGRVTLSFPSGFFAQESVPLLGTGNASVSNLNATSSLMSSSNFVLITAGNATGTDAAILTISGMLMGSPQSNSPFGISVMTSVDVMASISVSSGSIIRYDSPTITLSSVVAGSSNVTISIFLVPSIPFSSGSELIVTLSGSPSCGAGTSVSFSSPASGAAGVASILNSILTVTFTSGVFAANSAIVLSFGGVRNPMAPQAALTNVQAAIVSNVTVRSLDSVGSFPEIVMGRMGAVGARHPTVSLSHVMAGFNGAAMAVTFIPSSILPSDSTVLITLSGSPKFANATSISFVVPEFAIGVATIADSVMYVNFLSGFFAANLAINFTFQLVSLPALPQDAMFNVASAVTSNTGVVIAASSDGTFPSILNASFAIGSPTITLSSTLAGATDVRMTVSFSVPFNIPNNAQILVTLTGSSGSNVPNSAGPACLTRSWLQFVYPSVGASGMASITSISGSSSMFLLTIQLLSGSYDANLPVLFSFGSVRNPFFAQAARSNIVSAIVASSGVVLALGFLGRFPEIQSLFVSAPAVTTNQPLARALGVRYMVSFRTSVAIPSNSVLVVTLTGFALCPVSTPLNFSSPTSGAAGTGTIFNKVLRAEFSSGNFASTSNIAFSFERVANPELPWGQSASLAAAILASNGGILGVSSNAKFSSIDLPIHFPPNAVYFGLSVARVSTPCEAYSFSIRPNVPISANGFITVTVNGVIFGCGSSPVSSACATLVSGETVFCTMSQSSSVFSLKVQTAIPANTSLTFSYGSTDQGVFAPSALAEVTNLMSFLSLSSSGLIAANSSAGYRAGAYTSNPYLSTISLSTSLNIMGSTSDLTVSMFPRITIPSNANIVITLTGLASCSPGTPLVFTSPSTGAAGFASVYNDVLTISFVSGSFASPGPVLFEIPNFGNPSISASSQTLWCSIIVGGVIYPSFTSNFPALINLFGSSGLAVRLSSVVMGNQNTTLTVSYSPTSSIPSNHAIIITLTGIHSCTQNTALLFSSPVGASGVSSCLQDNANVLIINISSGTFTAGALVQFAIGNLTNSLVPMSNLVYRHSAVLVDSFNVRLGATFVSTFPSIINGSMGTTSPAFTLSSLMAGKSGVVWSLAFTPVTTLNSNSRLVVTLSGSPSCGAGTSVSFSSPASGAAGVASILNSILTVTFTSGVFAANSAIVLSFGGVRNPMAPQAALTNVQAAVLDDSGVIVAASSSGLFPYILSNVFSAFNSSLYGPVTGAVRIQSFGAFFSLERSCSASVHQSTCEATAWSSSSAFMCKLPAGSGSGLSLTLSYLPTSRGSAVAAFTYGRSSILVMNILSNPLQLQLAGSSFGSNVAVQSVSPTCNSDPRSISSDSANSTIVCESLGLLTSEISSSKIVGFSFSFIVSQFNRLDNVHVFAMTPAGTRIDLMKDRCFGCTNSSIQVQFSSDSNVQLPTTNCISGVYGISSLSSVDVINLLNSNSIFGSWSLHASVVGSRASFTISKFSMTFVVATLQFSVGRTPVSELLWRSDSAVQVTAPVGYGNGLVVAGKSGDSAMDVVTPILYSYPLPMLLNVSQLPVTAVRTSSTLVALTGVHFSLMDATPRSRMASTSCQASMWISDTATYCRQHHRSLAVSQMISIVGNVSQLPKELASVPSVVDAVSMSSAASTGSTVFRLSGSSFMLVDVSSRTRLHVSASVQSSWISDSYIVLKTPTLNSQFVPATVSVGLVRSMFNISLTRDFSSNLVEWSVPSTGSHVRLLSFGFMNTFLVTQLSAAVRYGKSSCEWSRWLSHSSISVKIPSAFSSYETSFPLVMSIGTCCQRAATVATFSSIAPQLTSVKNASVTSVLSIFNNRLSTCSSENCIAVVMNGSGFGTQTPSFGGLLSAQVGFDRVTGNCVDVFWNSDSSLYCLHQLAPSGALNDAVMFSISFLNSVTQGTSSASIKNPYFVPKQYPLADVVSFWIHPGPVSNQPDSTAWDTKELSQILFGSGQLIDLAIIFVNNNSQPYITSSGYTEVVAIITSIQFTPINSSLAKISACAQLDFPSKLRIPAGSVSQVHNFAIALCFAGSLPVMGHLEFSFELQGLSQISNSSVRASSPFTLYHFASAQLSVSTHPGNVVAMESVIPLVTFKITVFPSVVACGDMLFQYTAFLVCNNAILQSKNATSAKSCDFAPDFNGTIPVISEDCHISASLPFLNQSVVRSPTFSSTFGTESFVEIIGTIPRQLSGGQVLASGNVSEGSCLIAQLFDKNGFPVRRMGIVGTLAAFVDSRPYGILGNRTTASNLNGTLFWCSAKTSSLALNIVLRLEFPSFFLVIPGTFNVSSAGTVSSVTLQRPPPSNASLLPGAPPPPVTLSLLDAGGNSFQTAKSTFVRVRVFSRRTSTNVRQLLQAGSGDYVAQSESTCPGGGVEYIQLAASSNFTVNSSAVLCTAGDNLVVYDVVNMVNGSIITVLFDSIFSFDVLVIPGPPVLFALQNSAQLSLPTHTVIINATSVLFLDVGRNIVFGNDSLAVSISSAEVVYVGVNGSNSTEFVSNMSGSSIMLLLSSPINLSGKNIFLPSYTVSANFDRNFSRLRLFFSASAVSLQYLPSSNAFVDLIPKCTPGTRVTAVSFGVFECSPCPSSTFASTVDAYTCRFVSLFISSFLRHVCDVFRRFCGAGHIANRDGEGCSSCVENTYKPYVNSSVCSDCPAQFFASPNHDTCLTIAFRSPPTFLTLAKSVSISGLSLQNINGTTDTSLGEFSIRIRLIKSSGVNVSDRYISAFGWANFSSGFWVYSSVIPQLGANSPSNHFTWFAVLVAPAITKLEIAVSAAVTIVDVIPKIASISPLQASFLGASVTVQCVPSSPATSFYSVLSAPNITASYCVFEPVGASAVANLSSFSHNASVSFISTSSIVVVCSPPPSRTTRAHLFNLDCARWLA
jgi:hypothetical protein